jgi:hypothetical protein
MQDNPYATSAEEAAVSAPIPYAQLGLGVLATIVVSALDAWLAPWSFQLPGLPAWTLLLLLPLMALAGACALGLLPRAALWPVTLAIPIAVLVVVNMVADQAQLGPAINSFKAMAFHALWASTLGGLVTAAWLGVPLRHLPAFLAAVGLKTQLIMVGIQVLAPGLAVALLFALFEVVASRDEPGSWVLGSILAVARSPLAWGVAFGGAALGVFLSLAVPFLGGKEAGLTASLDPTAVPFPIALLSGVVYSMVSGAALAVAARMLPRP